MDAFAALAEPNRRYILEMLARRGKLSASDISDKFSISPPAVSQHLKVLLAANLIVVEKRAQQRIYQINPPAILEIETWAKKMTEIWDHRFESLDALLEKKKNYHSKFRKVTHAINK